MAPLTHMCAVWDRDGAPDERYTYVWEGAPSGSHMNATKAWTRSESPMIAPCFPSAFSANFVYQEIVRILQRKKKSLLTGISLGLLASVSLSRRESPKMFLFVSWMSVRVGAWIHRRLPFIATAKGVSRATWVGLAAHVCRNGGCLTLPRGEL
jgi:hypothetical protein